MTGQTVKQRALERLANLPSEIHTPRLVITPMTARDMPAMEAAMRESWHALRRWTAIATEPQDKSILEYKAINSGRQDDFNMRAHFVMVARTFDSNDVVASVELYNVSEDGRKMEAGYWTREKYKNRGLTTEAMTAMMHWGLDHIGALHIKARCADDNVFSEKILTKIGFELSHLDKNLVTMPIGRVIREKHFTLNAARVPAMSVTYAP